MVAFVIPKNCGRCGKRSNNLGMLNMPILPAKKQGKKLVFPYTPVVYLCKNCVKELLKWVEGLWSIDSEVSTKDQLNIKVKKVYVKNTRKLRSSRNARGKRRKA